MRMKFNHTVCELDSLFGCDQVCVSHNVFVDPDKRNQGHGEQAHKERLNTMISLGYDYTLCTVNSANDVEKKILKKNGWRQLSSFSSSKTGHWVEIWGRALVCDKQVFDPNSLEYKTYDQWEKSITREE